MKKMSTVCKLCKKERKICKSHIYPEYMYKNAYDGNHKISIYSAVSFTKRQSTGAYERLLCLECERIIKGYEDYAKELLYSQIIPDITSKSDGITVSNHNYQLTKLFFASLLWRASLSSHDLVKGCNLGPYEETLRIHLLNGCIIDEDDFPLLIMDTHIGGKRADGIFVEMGSRKSLVNGKTFYHAVIDGFFLVFGVGKVGNSHLHRNGCLTKSVMVVVKKDLLSVSEFSRLYSDVQQQGKFFS